MPILDPLSLTSRSSIRAKAGLCHLTQKNWHLVASIVMSLPSYWMDEIHPGARVKGIAKIYPMYRYQYHVGHLEAAGRLANHLGSDPSLEVTKSDVEALSGHDVRCSCLDVVICT